MATHDDDEGGECNVAGSEVGVTVGPTVQDADVKSITGGVSDGVRRQWINL